MSVLFSSNRSVTCAYVRRRVRWRVPNPVVLAEFLGWILGWNRVSTRPRSRSRDPLWRRELTIKPPCRLGRSRVKRIPTVGSRRLRTRAQPSSSAQHLRVRLGVTGNLTRPCPASPMPRCTPRLNSSPTRLNVDGSDRLERLRVDITQRTRVTAVVAFTTR